MNKHFCSLLLSIFVMFCSFAMVSTLHAQDIDLGIRFTTDPPETVKINGFYGVKVEVFMDENTSAIPSGEIIRAKIDVIDPDGLPIDGLSYVKLWSGFQDTTNGFITNDGRFPDQFTFQIPWSQQEKWADNAEWTILAQVFSPSLDANAENNVVEKKIKMLLPDLTVSNLDVKAIDPKSGLTTDNFVTSTNYSVSGVIENIGEVVTQNGIYVPLVAELINTETGNVLDTQTILIPDTTEHFENAYIATDQQINFTIDQLFLPASESSYQNFNIRVRINPQDLPGGPAMKEQSFADNTASASFSLSTNDADVVTASALLEYVPNSYKGETGTFRGLEPIFLSFAIRNSGNSPVLSTDSISASIILSQDLSVDSEDFILREFNLGGNGIGQGMLAGETINLTWFQQLPDNFEGDYYILIRLSNNHLAESEPRRDQVSSLDSTPILTMQSQNKGVTQLVETTWSGANDTASERPDSSKSGRFVVFEKEVPAIDAGTSGKSYKQIFYLDMQQLEPAPKLVTRSYGSAFSNIPANGDSFRPRISDDGSTIVFYSRASNLVPGDSNGKEDIFIYQISTKTMRRIVNDSTGSELNGRSLYPDVNGDGSRIVFETDATNALTTGIVSQGRQIFLWSKRSSGAAEIVALTSGEASSFNPSIDESGNRIVFESYANLLKDSTPSTPDDNNSLKDIYLIELNSTNQNPSTDYFIESSVQLNEQTLPTTTYLVSLNFRGRQTEKSSNLLNPGHSSNARISGNGESIVFESNAQNLISGTGIAKVVVTEGGFGYQGTPSVEITDEGFNAKGAPGEGAILILKKQAINALEEIVADGVLVIDSGTGYTDPKVRIIPDPLYPAPALEAQAVAYLGNPGGDIYMVKVGDLNGSIATRKYAYRISEDHPAESANDNNGTGGNFASRDPSISWDGRSVVYSTKSYNLLQDSISREDGKTFFNSVYVTPSAEAVIVGEIGEIEIAEMGTGYSAGNLRIEDMSGSGSGALASYEVDNLGRIVSINVVSGGADYNLDHTVVSVEEPRGGEGFVAGKLRFPQAIGEGSLRTGGGRIHRIEMTNHGYGFKVNSSESSTFSELFDFEGDGADLDNDGFPDGRVDPRLIHEFQGRVYLEQKFSVEVMSDGADLLNTRLSIAYKNNFLNPLVIDFSNGVSTSSTTININGLSSTSEIRDEIIRLIVENLDINSSRQDSPVIEDNASGESAFSFSALSGKFSTTNPATVKVIAHSNMLVRGSGYTKASPVINQVPAIFGFSEISSNPIIEGIEESQGRMSLLVERDEITDDIYLYSVNEMDEAKTERISVSSFGTPIMYLSATDDENQQVNSLPSNRFPVISGNGRYVFFTSDSSGREGIGFEGSNQLPTDMNPSRDLYMRDLKTEALIEQKASLEILYPNNLVDHEFASSSEIPIIAQLHYDGYVSKVDVYLRQMLVGELTHFGGGNDGSFQSNRFSGRVPVENKGDYSLYLVAYDGDGDVIATSSLINFSVKEFSGSLPPELSLAVPVFDRITSTSVLPLSVSGSDVDGILKNVRFYVDGNGTYLPIQQRDNALEEQFQAYSTLFDLGDWIEKRNLSEDGGIISFFAMGEDNSGNLVPSETYSISYTGGSTPPQISMSSRETEDLLTHGNEILFDIHPTTGEILDIDVSVGHEIGNRLFAARISVFAENNASGAKISPVIDFNVSSSTFGQIIEFMVVDGGLGYDETKTSLQIVPIVNAVSEGVPAELSITPGLVEEENATSVSRSITLKKNADGSLINGSGYVMAPQLFLEPTYNNIRNYERLSLEETTGPSSSIADFGSIDFDDPVFPPGADTSISDRPILVGGFSQSSILFDFDVNVTNELISEVSLVVDGVKVDSKKRPPYSFLWVPMEAKEYTVSALVLDYFGNVASTKTSRISIGNYFGSGMNMKLLGSDEMAVEGDGTLLLFAEASSQFGIAEVEYFISGVSVGRVSADSIGNRFALSVDMQDHNFSQGNHFVDAIARDKLGNQAGTFSPNVTNLKARKSKVLTILPPTSIDSENLYFKLVYPSDMSSLIDVKYIEGLSSGYIGAVDLIDRQGLVGTVQMKVDGEVISEQNVTEDSTGRFFFSWNNMTPGSHLISFHAVAKDGNLLAVSSFEEVGATLDVNGTLEINGTLEKRFGYEIFVEKADTILKAPQVSMTFPTTGFTVTTQSDLLLAASYSDEDGVVEKLQYMLNGKIIPEGNFTIDDPKETGFHTMKWPPPGTASKLSAGLHSFSVLVEDSSGIKSISNPVTVIVAPSNDSEFGNSESFDFFLPDTSASGGIIRTTDRETRQAIAKVSRTAKSYDVSSATGENNTLNLVGAIISIDILDPGKGYRSEPQVKFIGPGYNASFLAEVDFDTFSSKFGQVVSIYPVNEESRGTGYSDGFPDDYYYSYLDVYTTDVNGTVTNTSRNMQEPTPATEVVLEGGHDITEVPLEAIYSGNVENLRDVSFIANGRILDVNEDGKFDFEDSFRFTPFATSYSFYPGVYDLYILSRDSRNNVRFSEVETLKVEANKGLRPSVALTYPMLSSNATLVDDRMIFESIGASSKFPIFIDASDEDGQLQEISLYANHSRIPVLAQRVGDTNKYMVEVDQLNLNSGKYVFTAGAIDNDGNFERSTEVPIEIVSTRQAPPDISLVAPIADGDNFSVGVPISFTVQVRIKERPVSQVEFIVDGVVVDTQRDPAFTIGDLAFYSGSWTPTTSRSSIMTAVVTDLSGVKVRTGSKEEYIFHLPSVEKVLNGEPVSGVNYEFINFVGNRVATPLVSFEVVSGYGLNFQPTTSLIAPETGSVWKPNEEISFSATVNDRDGQAENMYLQYFVNGGNALLHFKEPLTRDFVLTFFNEVTYDFILTSNGRVDVIGQTSQNLNVTNHPETLARAFSQVITTDLTNRVFDTTELSVSYMPENLFSSAMSHLTESYYQTVYFRIDRFAQDSGSFSLNIRDDEISLLPDLVSSTGEGELELERIPLQNTYGKSHQLTWTPKMGGAYVVHAEVTDAFSRLTKTMSNHAVIFVGRSMEPNLIPANFNSSLTIFPEEFLQEPAPRGSAVVVKAEYFNEITGVNIDDNIEKVEFFLNGKPEATDDNPPFSANINLNLKSTTWRIDAVAHKFKEADIEFEKFTAFLEGNLTSPVQTPKLTLSPPTPDYSATGFMPGMEISVSAVFSGSSNLLSQVQGVEFYLEGERVLQEPTRSDAGTNSVREIIYTVTFPLDLANYDGQKSITAIGRMLNSIIAIPAQTQDAQNAIIIDFDDKYSNDLSKSPAQIFYSLTGENAGEAEINEFYNAGEDIATWVASLRKRPSLSMAVDIVGAHHTSLGYFHNTYSSFSSDYQTYADGMNSDDEAWLKSYIDDLLSSSSYNKRFTVVPHLVGPYSRRFFENYRANRESFVAQCLNNKYGKSSFQQSYQGSLRLLNHWSKFDSSYWELSGRGGGTESNVGSFRIDGANYSNGELAVELIYSLVKERLYLGKDPFIYGADPLRDSVYTAYAYAYLLYQDDLPNNFGQDRNSLAEALNDPSFFGKSFQDQADTLINNYRYTSKFNLLFGGENAIEGAPGWKKEDWFGSLFDTFYPWVYHSKLGWLYLSGSSKRNFWGYSEKLGWLWFSTSGYPHVFSASEDNWIYFDTESSGNPEARAKGSNSVYYYSYKYRGWAKL